ncbi:hypothetical protein HNP84_008398 [Thermocatellispora tengchongensis]|uniref:Uncharacterized protein n=1 Tax=Thermocatellispora tengchongensis TaxID=1073253 RepID=A0A840PB67_9ACTN|nr:hypothetical protein [Thermocatellispora tengchongensis]MBB5138644.1 hypothetical protein [Thermocatellispora tengchongensis]
MAAPSTSNSFLLAASVLNGASMVKMTSAALDLAGRIDSTSPPDVAWSAFDETLQQWLQYADAVAGVEAVPEGRRRIGLRVPAMSPAILYTAWHNHPALRGPMTAWLHDLAGDPEPEVQISLAQAIGKLATYDFAEIDAEFIRKWATSRRVTWHRMAAWALEAAAQDPRFTESIRRRLVAWSESTLSRRSVAVHAYGTSLGRVFLHDGLAGLRRIAADPRPGLRDHVARSTVEHFLGGRRTEIVTELGLWARSGVTALHDVAARCLVRLAPIPAAGPDAPRPALLTMCADHEADIAGLWRAALLDDRTSGMALEILLGWVRHAEDAPGTADVLSRLVARLGAEEPPHHTLRFHLTLWRHRGEISGRLCTTLLAHLARKGL